MRRLSHHSKRFLARVHFWILGFSLFGYLALAFTLGPGFLSFDIGTKIRALADEVIVVTAVVLGPPATPVVTATPSCVSGNPRITLDWADNAASTSWDIERDSAPLVSGLTSSGYIDTAVTGTVTYEYVVTAYGPMAPGTATSLPVSATAIDCSTLLPDPTLTLTHIGDENITPPRTLPIEVDKNQPRVQGNTNIVNAEVTLTLDRPAQIAHISANENGYFTWKPPRTVRTGEHTLTVTVTDPDDASRTITESLVFSVEDTEEDEEDEETEKSTVPSGDFGIPPANIPIVETFNPTVPTGPVSFELDFSITELLIQQGQRINFTIKPERGLLPKDMVFEASLLTQRGKVVFTAPKQTIVAATRSGLALSIRTPLYLPPDKYTLSVVGTFQDTSVTRAVPIVIHALPVLQLGANKTITYGEIASIIGWIAFGTLTSLVSFATFLLREYGLSLRIFRPITGREFLRFGLLALREGVRKR